MIIMSVDYGDVRTGIAICDRLETLAYPVTVIKESYEPKLIAKIAEIVKEKKPDMIVVGYPKNMDSSEGSRAQKCRDFSIELSEFTGVPTDLWDERLTTVTAHSYLNDTNTRGKKRKETVDAVAATVILQDYIDHRRNSNAQ